MERISTTDERFTIASCRNVTSYHGENNLFYFSFLHTFTTQSKEVEKCFYARDRNEVGWQRLETKTYKTLHSFSLSYVTA